MRLNQLWILVYPHKLIRVLSVFYNVILKRIVVNPGGIILCLNPHSILVCLFKKSAPVGIDEIHPRTKTCCCGLAGLVVLFKPSLLIEKIRGLNPESLEVLNNLTRRCAFFISDNLS